MEIVKIVNSVFSSNTYILSHEFDERCWLVDCGDVEPIVDWIQINNKRLIGVFLTHTHFDHIYGLNQIVSLFPDCIIYTSEMGEKGLFSDKLNFSRYNCSSFIYKFDNIIILKNNDTLVLFSNIIMNVFSTPGHDWSCLTYCCGEELFTGDSYLPDYKIVTNFPKSVKIQAEISCSKIIDIIGSGIKNVFPGHGNIAIY